MSKSICGIKCDDCHLNTQCCGCTESGGKPFGGTCIVAECCKNCGESERADRISVLKNEIIAEINSLGIPDMPEVKDLYFLRGSFVNLEYELPSGQRVKFWDDDRIYLGCQLEREGSDRCYGIVADENYLMVCEYGCNGSEPELVMYKKRK